MAELTIQSSRFGEIVIEDDRVLEFVRPIIGFEHLSRFILLDHDEDSPFRWLQSTEEEALAFVVTNPNFFGIDYDFTIPEDVVQELGLASAEDVLALTIVKIPHHNPAEMTANLLGPLIINTQNLRGCQFILSDSPYSTQTRLIPDVSADTDDAAEDNATPTSKPSDDSPAAAPAPDGEEA